jgi:MYXO-CTERM domain-containing protein
MNMQRTMIWAAAAALSATPAIAQNNAADTNVANVTEVNTVEGNDMAAMNGMAVPPATNMDVGMAPPPEETMPTPAPEPAREREFPWGIIGLVGLVGLLGRRRRD